MLEKRHAKSVKIVTLLDKEEASSPPVAPPPTPRKVRSPEEQARADVWNAAVSVLADGGCPESQRRTFMGKLVKDYGFPVAKQAVEAAVIEQPASARDYLKATCQRLKGERKNKQEELEQRGQDVVDDWASGGSYASG